MYDDIIDLAMDQQLLTAINTSSDNSSRLPVWRELFSKSKEDLESIRSQLSADNLLTFDIIFEEPIGYYFIKSYLKSQHSIDKAIFVRDVDIFKTLNDPAALKEVANRIFNTFCTPETPDRVKGTSSLYNLNTHLLGIKALKYVETSSDRSSKTSEFSRFELTECEAITEAPSCLGLSSINETFTDTNSNDLTETPTTRTPVQLESESKSNPHDNSDLLLSHGSSNKHYISPIISELRPEPEAQPQPQPQPQPKVINTKAAFWSEDSNAIGCYGQPVRLLKKKLNAEEFETNMFDQLVRQILSDLKLDVFPRFLKSKACDLYLRCKALEEGRSHWIASIPCVCLVVVHLGLSMHAKRRIQGGCMP
eukprot:87302_1